MSKYTRESIEVAMQDGSDEEIDRIVRAVNAHEALVKALTFARDEAAAMGWAGALARYEAALKLAQGS